jgi:hypothetical protein
MSDTKEVDENWVILETVKEKPPTFGSQSTYGGFGLSLGYGHMMTEVVDNRNLAVRYYDIANVDVGFAIKMFVVNSHELHLQNFIRRRTLVSL